MQILNPIIKARIQTKPYPALQDLLDLKSSLRFKIENDSFSNEATSNIGIQR